MVKLTIEADSSAEAMALMTMMCGVARQEQKAVQSENPFAEEIPTEKNESSVLNIREEINKLVEQKSEINPYFSTELYDALMKRFKVGSIQGFADFELEDVYAFIKTL